MSRCIFCPTPEIKPDTKNMSMCAILCFPFCYSEPQEPLHEHAITNVPFVPNSLSDLNGRRSISISFSDGTELLRFTRGSTPVNGKSLEMIREQLRMRFVNHEDVMNELRDPLPTSTVAVSMPMNNFHCGDKCHEFLLDSQYDAPSDSYYSYQRITDNIQVTYYNENGIEYTAGFTYYPESIESIENLNRDKAVIIMVWCSCEPYPSSARDSFYTRICSKRGRKTVIYLTSGNAFHMDYHHKYNPYKYTKCRECTEEAKNYKWVDPLKAQKAQIIKGYPKTTEPYVPDILEKAVSFEVIENLQEDHIIGIQLAPENMQIVSSASLWMIKNCLNRWFPEISKSESMKLDNLLKSRNVICVSLAMINFAVGESESCGEFYPDSDYEISSGAFYTYQRLSENVQITFLNEYGVEYLAGITYYPELSGHGKMMKNDQALINCSLIIGEKYPREENENVDISVNYGRYCEKVKKRVIVECDEEKGAGSHLEFDHWQCSYHRVKCQECFEDLIAKKKAKELRKKATREKRLKFIRQQLPVLKRSNSSPPDMKYFLEMQQEKTTGESHV
ncbi:hypothetical protein GCK72_001528 [Caenorhabditis remanei]|uniref:Uncharacterized protein n=1 Tax=Caenorhabditis remanei TaxID=31234 RepID=A0A6A5HR35_CAERE|nr:hypothetical protein GCK72_001528 [Caenorhabditis remanei]KAF1769711.1 hypothetical protein GCK72_001528 [Caenorhabditis remanei]